MGLCPVAADPPHKDPFSIAQIEICVKGISCGQPFIESLKFHRVLGVSALQWCHFQQKGVSERLWEAEIICKLPTFHIILE